MAKASRAGASTMTSPGDRRTGPAPASSVIPESPRQCPRTPRILDPVPTMAATPEGSSSRCPTPSSASAIVARCVSAARRWRASTSTDWPTEDRDVKTISARSIESSTAVAASRLPAGRSASSTSACRNPDGSLASRCRNSVSPSNGPDVIAASTPSACVTTSALDWPTASCAKPRWSARWSAMRSALAFTGTDSMQRRLSWTIDCTPPSV